MNGVASDGIVLILEGIIRYRWEEKGRFGVKELETIIC